MKIHLLFLILVAEFATPVTEFATPVAEFATPVAEFATPVAEFATPVAEFATPVAEFATPVAEFATPVAKFATPVAEFATPVAEFATPVAEFATPVAEFATPVAEFATPVTEFATLVAEFATPVAELASPAQCSGQPVGNEKAEHVFSMSCKVTSCNNELSTRRGMKKLIRWCRENHLSKIWLESYRHGEIVPSDLLMAERDELRRAGFEVCGLVTPTSLGPAGEDGNSPIEVCWSNSQARERLSGEIRRTAEMFDVIIIDDFLFTNHDDECPSCASDKAGRGIEDWEEYRRALLMEVSLENIIKPAKEVNPSVQVIIKYPCWWQDWEKRGYSPAAQAELFGKCWIGTETRDANPDPTQSCWIVDHIDRLTGGRCAGGWYDGLDCSPHRFLLQAYYTILGGAKESLIHCYDYLLASDPGRTPYGEKSNRSHECAAAFEEKSDDIYNLAQLLCGAEAVSYEIDENDVSTHVYRKDGDTLVVKFDANSLSWMQAEPSAIGLLKVE